MVIVHPAYARRMAATAAMIKEHVLSTLDELLYELEHLHARCPVAPTGALDQLNMAIAAVADIDFTTIATRDDGAQIAQLRAIIREARELATEMTLAYILHRLRALGADTQHVAAQ